MLARYDEEVESLQASYEAEVQRCADLRTELDLRQAEVADIRASLDGELLEAQRSLEEVQREECAMRMSIEDDWASAGRLLQRHDADVLRLEERLRHSEADLRRLQGAQGGDSAVEDALKSADKELSELQSVVRSHEKIVANLEDDVKVVLEYIMIANIEAAGGPSPSLGPEAFLPSAVREHLDLSEEGRSQLARLDQKFKQLMREHTTAPALQDVEDEEVPPTAPAVARPPAPPQAQAAAWAPAPASPLVAAGLEVDEESAWGSDDVPHDDEEDLHAVSAGPPPRPACPTVAASGSLEEEGRLLREELTRELQELAAAIAPRPSNAWGGATEPPEPMRDLLRAAARGDEAQVKVWLHVVDSAGVHGEVSKLGWTVWHVAAAYGQAKVLELLKQDMVDRAAHHRAALGRPTRMGLPPLGVACLAGQAEAARALLLGMAPVDSRDARGNTPLIWALISGQASVLVPLLLDARADPDVANHSGQRPDISGFVSTAQRAATVTSARGSSAATVPTVGSRPVGGVAAVEPYHVIRALGSEPPKQRGVLSYALSILKAPVRDAAGFASNAKARSVAQLSVAEADAGVWSEWVINYTHAGLRRAVEAPGQHANADPTLSHWNAQVLVLTTDRILFFHAGNWSLMQVVPLSELAAITVFAYSPTLVALRMHGLADLLLDIEASVRGRLLDELELATRTLAAPWGGDEFGEGASVQQEGESVTHLQDENRRLAATLAFVETDVFLFLAYAPKSLFLAGGDTFFFGLLDLHHSSVDAKNGTASWRWQTYFFMLKSGPGEARRLTWCLHPNDERSAGSLRVSRLLAVQPLDTPRGEPCVIIDYQLAAGTGSDSAGGVRAMTLRATSPQNREDWIVSIRTMQGT